MNPTSLTRRRSRQTLTPALDLLESRQLLSAATMPAHHHHTMRLHHAAAVERFHSGHHVGADPAAIPATSTTFTMVAQFNASFSATASITDKNIWAVGSSASSGTQQPFAAHFDGTSWSAVPTPNLSRGGVFNDVSAVASNDVWAVGYQNVANSINALIEHWDGTSWSIVSSPRLANGAYLQAVTAISSTDIWAAGDINVSREGILMEHWDGTSWSVATSTAFSGVGPIYDIAASAANDVWAVGGNTSLHFDGTSWTRVPGVPTVNMGSVLALSSTDVWASGVGPGATRNAFPRATFVHWNGTSWSIVSSPNPHPNTSSGAGEIAAVSADDIFGLALGVIEQWNGSSWTIVDTLSGFGATGITALSDGTIVVVGENGGILHN
jgi:hypothetical protein